MIFIGICGASGSGKSTLAEELTRDLSKRCVVLQQDCYYKDQSHRPFEERVKINWDEPAIFDHDLLYQDVCDLMAGKSIRRRGYDYTRHARNDTDEMIEPADVLVLEGIHTFYDPRLLKKMFLRLYISVEPDICLLRRIQRDINERGRAIDNIFRAVSQYGQAHVRPVHPQLCEGCGRGGHAGRQERPHRGNSVRIPA